MGLEASCSACAHPLNCAASCVPQRAAKDRAEALGKAQR